MKTRHHLIPRSRQKELKIRDIDDPRNIRLIEDHLHRAWHKLFQNKTPYEVMNILWKYHETNDKIFCKSHEYWILFGHSDYIGAIYIVDTEWTPSDAFYKPKKSR